MRVCIFIVYCRGSNIMKVAYIARNNSKREWNGLVEFERLARHFRLRANIDRAVYQSSRSPLAASDSLTPGLEKLIANENHYRAAQPLNLQTSPKSSYRADLRDHPRMLRGGWRCGRAWAGVGVGAVQISRSLRVPHVIGAYANPDRW
jgi:hypothetical protein